MNVARQASIAIESAKLYLQIERRAEQMSTLALVGRDITATLEIDDVMERIAGHAREAPRLPVRLGCLDAILAGRDEIPPQVPRSIE